MAAGRPGASVPVSAAHSVKAGLGQGDQSLDWRGRRHHRDRGIDGGDILAGVLILGGIAAIASAASNSNKDRQVRDDYRYDEPYQDQRPDYYESRGYSGGGIDNAVDMCVGQVERGSDRVASVDNTSRTTDGWRISGQLSAGGGFSCWIDNDGRIRNVDLGGGYYGASAGGDYYQSGADVQWDDNFYAQARSQAGYASPDRGGYANY